MESQNTERLPASLQPFDLSTHARICSRLEAAGIPADALTVMEDLKTMITGKDMNRAEAAGVLFELWPEYQGRIIEDLHGTINCLAAEAVKLPDSSPERRKIAEQIRTIGAFQEEISRITRERFMVVFFPDLMEGERQEAPASAKKQPHDSRGVLDPGAQRFAHAFLGVKVAAMPQGPLKDVFRFWADGVKDFNRL